MRRRRSRGFTLIELLIVVAIIGILAAIAIVNYLTALDRSRQKRTMSDMRTIASAWEARAAEAGSFAAGFTFPDAVTFDTVQEKLTPGFIKKLPKVDGWGREFQFGAVGKVYAIRSAGRDGLFETGDYTADETSSPDCDIVYANGTFVRHPASVQNAK